VTEADLHASPLKQRPRAMAGDLIDLREIPKPCCGAHAVLLIGGPYHGRKAAVNNHMREAWVIGAWGYELRDGAWQWSELE
jgi:hypothetical protein